MKVLVFAKKRQTKDGKNFTSYVSKLTKKNGEEITAGVKFREECGAPKAEECPWYIKINKTDANLAVRKTEITTDEGEIKEIEQVKEIPYGMNLEDWFEKEGFKIESYLQENKENYNLIVDGNNFFLLDYKTKRFEYTELNQDFYNFNFDKFDSYYYTSMTKTFYKLKGWEFPKVKEVIKIKNLKYGECFRLYDAKYKRLCNTKYKFICTEDNVAIVKSLDRNIIFVYDKDIEVIRCEGED